MAAALEAGKVLGIVLLWLISYVCGKKRFAEPQQETQHDGTHHPRCSRRALVWL